MEASGQHHAPAALPQGKSPYYPLDRRLGGPQSRSGRSSEEKNSHILQKERELKFENREFFKPDVYLNSFKPSK
jgi:hypothetical protein